MADKDSAVSDGPAKGGLREEQADQGRRPEHPPELVKPDLERGQRIIREAAKKLPNSSGVYRFVGAQDEVLYVGKARRLPARVSSYTVISNLQLRKRRMVAETLTVETTSTHTEAEALLLEANLIKRHRPRYNVNLRDDKSYPYLALYQDHPFALLSKHRGAKTRKGKYYGPFASAGAVARTITGLHKAFLLRSCSDSVFRGRSRPCLQYHIKRCTAPCVGFVTEEAYAEQVDLAVAFLEGRSRAVQESFVETMQAAAERMEYEVAARYRDRIRALTMIQSRQDISLEGIADVDVVAMHAEGGVICIAVAFFRGGTSYGTRDYFPAFDEDDSPSDVLTAFLGQFYEDKVAPKEILLSEEVEQADLVAEALSLNNPMGVEIKTPKRGNRKRLVDAAMANARDSHGRHLVESTSQKRFLTGVAKLFDLDGPPNRIEVYDNSHIQGAFAYGAMIVAGPDGFEKKSYRKYKIRNDDVAGDDFGMMREVMTRRFSRAQKEDPDRKEGTWPDLVLIDGGLGQLNAVRQVLEDLGVSDVPLVSIAKGPDRNAGREDFYMPDRAPFSLPPNDEVLFFLQRLRDEAHRFVIGSHRTGRQKQISASPLDDIPNIGPKRKKALLLHFGSAKAVKRAGLSDLEAVEGISKTVAHQIYDHFRATE